MIDNLKTFGEWKTNLTMKINLVYTIDSLEYCKMYCKIDSLNIIIGFDTNEIIKEDLTIK